jgi:hypothetical protein
MKSRSYKYKSFKLCVTVLVLFLISSCGKNTKDYSGVYKSGDKFCEIEIVITKINGEYQYEINSEFRNESGLLQVSETENDVYFNFNGLLGVNPKEEIGGKYMNETIIIQNSGNAMNQYLRFSECDIKYIELAKIKQD